MVAMTVSAWLYYILNPFFVMLLSPLFLGIIKKTKALCQGRIGPPLLQPYYQLTKLFKKEIIYSPSASSIMRISPYLNIAFLTAAAVLVPVLYLPDSSMTFGNIILFLYLMVSAKFFMALAGLDTGSTFGAMGSSREMTISSIIEPATILTCASLAFVLETTSIPDMFQRVLDSYWFEYPTLILTGISLFIILIVETARVPVDNPETHLELTMVHEAMILEQSGPNLALMELSYGIKQTILMALLINTLLPWGLATGLSAGSLLISAAAFTLKAGLLSIMIGIFESLLCKLRFFRLPDFFMVAFFLSFVTIVFELLK
jgi:formate hydrogenlyase subunit 4